MKWLFAFLLGSALMSCASPRRQTGQSQSAAVQTSANPNVKKLRVGMRPPKVRKLLGAPQTADSRVFETSSASPKVGQVWTYGDLHLVFEGDAGDWRLSEWKTGQ